MESLAGKLLDKGEDVVVIYDRDRNVYKDVQIRGRWLYCKKCVRPADWDGVAICDKTRGDTAFVLVLAKSKGCGKFHKLTRSQKELGMKSGVVMNVKPMDKVLCPDDSAWGIKQSPYCEDDYFIHECIVKCVIEE